ncbi:Cullin [Mucor lusitanicus CBS 277.49]|uniref:Cullin n=1 Tax=Mucor lusitanicus CBS 277.49 TaxID=747725 RepID=A0A168I306_MUCCL|nr:Cullin [Mucor lusitanicus CBS 277.49]
MTEWEAIKRPKLDNMVEQSSSMSSAGFMPLPFSRYLSNSFQHSQKHPILSDSKLVVYDLKVDRPELPTDYEETAWNRLKAAIHAIQKNEPPSESLEVLYQLCENLCQYDKAETLYHHLYEECRRYIEIRFEALASNSKEGDEYLHDVHLLWKSYCKQMTQIRCLFLYLDRTYIASTTKTGSMWNMAMDLFRENFSRYQGVWHKVLHIILDMIRIERIGQAVDEMFLQSNIRMLMDLNLYHSAFEQQLLVQTQQFYDKEGDRLLESINIFDYLEHVSTRVHQESILRVKSYFDKSTKSQLQSIVERELLTKRVESILAKCFDYFQSIDHFQDGDFDKFSLLYRLLQKVDKLEICAKYFTNYVKTKGSSILCDKTSIQDKISMIAAFDSQNDEVVDHSFEGDEQFVDGLKDGTDYFINLRENNTIKLLAKYTDQVLRNPVFDQELLEKGMFLFRQLQGKDEFEVLYKRDLAKRLLLNISHKSAEKMILAKMKIECGAGYTGKMEGMVKDIEKSGELMKEFHEYNMNTQPALNINVNLLTYGFWPSYIPINVNLPAAFHQAQEMYNQFYQTKFEKRVLTWQNSLSVCEITANYPNGTKQITLTLLQTIVLLLFNDTTRQAYSFTDILNYSQLDELELRRTLVSLSCREYKLLQKHPQGDDIKPTDVFSFNYEFYAAKDHLSMTTATLSEVIEKNARLDTTVLFAKDQQIDAVIVRIMKSRSTASHGSLLNEVTGVVRFPVTAQEIKKRIEVLIDKEYLERGPDDTYSYLA